MRLLVRNLTDDGDVWQVVVRVSSARHRLLRGGAGSCSGRGKTSRGGRRSSSKAFRGEACPPLHVTNERVVESFRGARDRAVHKRRWWDWNANRNFVAFSARRADSSTP